jgi:phospholipid-binding lipoprotein MlaA
MQMLGRLAAAALLAAALAGCATTGGTPGDPFEPFNRAMFKFNDKVDDYVMKPVSKGYKAAVPSLVRTGVTNFFSNLQDLWISANNLMQGKVEAGLGDFLRFTFNSTFGLAGIIDVASDMGLDKHNEDFGQTLGVWGVGSGPYLVLPFLGPSNVRDGLAFVVDFKADPVGYIDNVPVRNSLYGIRFVNTRTNLLDTTSILEEAALDRYTFVRDSWVQRRRSLIYDGNPPREPSDSDELQPGEPKSDQPKPDEPEPGGPKPGEQKPGEQKSGELESDTALLVASSVEEAGPVPPGAPGAVIGSCVVSGDETYSVIPLYTLEQHALEPHP